MHILNKNLFIYVVLCTLVVKMCATIIPLLFKVVFFFYYYFNTMPLYCLVLDFYVLLFIYVVCKSAIEV